MVFPYLSFTVFSCFANYSTVSSPPYLMHASRHPPTHHTRSAHLPTAPPLSPRWWLYPRPPITLSTPPFTILGKTRTHQPQRPLDGGNLTTDGGVEMTHQVPGSASVVCYLGRPYGSKFPHFRVPSIPHPRRHAAILESYARLTLVSLC